MQLARCLFTSLLATLVTVSALQDSLPLPTPPPTPTVENGQIQRRGDPTTYISIFTTEPPNNAYSIGMGQNGTGGNYCA